MHVFLLTILGFLLRVININKPEGLWNDEYVSWMVSAVPFGQGFWQEVLKQCHMPLYYLYLKPFVNCSDLILRMTSVISSVAAIVVMYYTGREYSKKAGIYAAAITAVLPFLIYYSQELRFYSILFLLSSIFLLFTVRVIKNFNKKNIACYVISALLIIFTHILGIIFVLINALYVAYKLRFQNYLNIINFKKNVFKPKQLLIFLLCVIVMTCIVALGLNILSQIPSSQWWGRFSYTNILFLFSDFLSPILTNHINAPPVFFYNKDIVFNMLLVIPTIIGLYGLIKSYKSIKGLLFVSLIFTAILAVFAVLGKIVFITKYLTEILPIIILSMSLGFSKDKLGKIFLIIFVLINFMSIVTVYHPIYKYRSEGHKIPSEILNKTNPDKIIYTYYAPDRFKRYLSIDSPSRYISKLNRFEYIDNPSRILDFVNSGERVSVVFLDSVSFIGENNIEYAKTHNIPEMFITFSIIRNELQKTLLNNCKSLNAAKRGSWTVLNCVKK